MNKDLIKAVWQEIDQMEKKEHWLEEQEIEVLHEGDIYHFTVEVEWENVDHSFSHEFGIERVFCIEPNIISVTFVDSEGVEVDVTSYIV
jgi:hypothetical protein